MAVASKAAPRKRATKPAATKLVGAKKPPAKKLLTKKSAPKRKAAAKEVSGGAMGSGPVSLLVSTMKGAFTLKSNATRSKWTLSGPTMLGQVINHLAHDPRTRKVRVMGAKTGHLGPTIYYTKDGGKTWKEASKPPAFPKKEGGKAVDANFFVTPGHKSQPNVWWAGTIPVGLFKSTDGGDTWEPVDSVNNHPDLANEAFGAPAPGGPYTHSVLIDPRDADHMYFGISCGGVLETTDGGKSWNHINKGSVSLFLPTPDAEFGQDPHCMVMSPSNPDVLWQQNHCGIYRMDRKDANWVRVGDNMPKAIGDIGFPVVVHPRDSETAWVFPMDGTEVWPRTSPGGKPATYMTTNGGKSWKRQDKGFPKTHGYFTVFRQAMKSDTQKNLGLYMGTTNGEVWVSTNAGGSWKCVARWLPRILAIDVVEGGR